MREHLKKLRALQELDLERDEQERSVQELRAGLEEHNAVIERLDAELQGKKEQLEETKSLLSTKQIELADTEERLTAAKNKFNSATNSREYAAAEREVEGYKKVQVQLSEELKQLSEAIDEAETSVLEKSEKINALKSELEAEHARIDEVESANRSRTESVDSKRGALEKEIRMDVLRRYQFIRKRRPGTKAIVAAVDGACTGCFMRVPPQLYIELQRGQSLETCQNCQRILYFPFENEEAA